MRILALMIVISTLGLPVHGRSDPLLDEQVSSVTALVLMGEWFGDAYFPLKQEIDARGWTKKGESFESAPVKEICDAVARELEKSPPRQSEQRGFPTLKGPYLGQMPPAMIPKIFAPEIVSRDGQQEKLNISPDHREIIFWERTSVDNSMRFVRMTRTDENWNAPEIIPFSTEYSNMEPTLSPDGLKLFFVSDRPLKKNEGAKKTPDIWFSEKAGGQWSEPRNIGPPVNGDGIEVQPFMSADHHFYFCLPPGEIYCSKIVDGKMQTPVRLSDNINKGRVSSPCLPPDCTYMIFHSNRAGGHGSWDLYLSFKDESGNWTEAKNMDDLNTPGSEGGPTISPDGKYLFFSRDGKIHWVSARIAEALRPGKTLQEKRSKP